MQIINTIDALESSILTVLNASAKIGLVPTMGALHDGHLSLINAAKKQCDFVICSIFVNPTQFNDQEDLQKYPRTVDSDLKLLETTACDLVFLPEVLEIYPHFPKNTNFIEINLSPLDHVMEGSARPGHFNGVANIVFRLFDIIKPHFAFFGQKDFQQVSIINLLIEKLNLPIELVALPTYREKSGLAMSSRNARLNQKQLQESTVIYKTLNYGKRIAPQLTPAATRVKMLELFNQSELALDYLEIVHPKTLVALSNDWVNGAVACIAAYCGEVRLIDNMVLFD